MYIICCGFYKKREKDLFKISGLILLTVVFMLNVQLISFIVEELNLVDVSIYDYKYYIIGGVFVFVLPILYIRYFKVTSYEEVNNSFHALNNFNKRKNYVFSVLYIVISFASTLGYAFYKGGHVSGWW
jgi:hypothetical protein